MTHSPAELFFAWLKGRSAATRVVIAVDGDRLLADAGLLGKEKLADTTGRDWRLVVFRGDDIGFRKSNRHARPENHVLIVLARSAGTQTRINVSHVYGAWFRCELTRATIDGSAWPICMLTVSASRPLVMALWHHVCLKLV